jgi:hypothetical protein
MHDPGRQCILKPSAPLRHPSLHAIFIVACAIVVLSSSHLQSQTSPGSLHVLGAVDPVPGDEVRYNAAAKEIMRESEIEIDDLWSVIEPSLANSSTAPGCSLQRERLPPFGPRGGKPQRVRPSCRRAELNLKNMAGTFGRFAAAMKFTESCLRFVVVLNSAMLVSIATAQYTHYPPEGQQIPPSRCLVLRDDSEASNLPCSQVDHQAWLADITHWRNERRIRIALDSSRYSMDALKWTRSSFVQPQMMVHDRFFYDVGAGKYTVDR